jgi:crotonobetainyl-CoA:carnitine CoA-transferase CaiB-like acyl-CoA transferase
MGASVTKVEPPGGDPMRVFPGLFELVNAGKRSVALDLKDDADRRRALALATDADVVVEGFRPGVADRLGVGYNAVAALNPDVVYCSISGYGQEGPFARVPGHDLNYQAMGGLVAPRPDQRPELPTVPVADLSAGAYAAMAMTAAWTRVLRTGEGERIDLAMTDIVASWCGPFDAISVDGFDAPMKGSAGNGVFETADGKWVSVAAIIEDHFWTRLATALGHPDLAALPLSERMARPDELRDMLAASIAKLDRDEVVERLIAADVPVAPVLSRREMLAHPQFAVRGQPAKNHPIRYAQHPARTGGRAPTLDEHREQPWP